jgi:hypothetical protein
VKETLHPDPQKERKEAAKDVEEIDKAKQHEQLDAGQAQEMTEDRMRKHQGTTKPTPAAAKKGKRKYHLTLLVQDHNGKATEGTWVLNFGSLRDEEFETTTTESTKTFEVELDTSRDNIFEFKGNPMLVGRSFPPGAEYYYHYLKLFPVVGTNPNLSMTISQMRRKKTVTASKTATTQEIKTKAVAEESGTQREYSVESGGLEELIIGKVAAKIIFFGKDTTTTTTGTTTGTSDTDSETYVVDILASRLAFKQKGQAQDKIDIDD